MNAKISVIVISIKAIKYLILYNLQLNPLNAKFTKWSNTLKQFVGLKIRLKG